MLAFQLVSHDHLKPFTHGTILHARGRHYAKEGIRIQDTF